jgi:hypothetical protein
VQLEEFSEEDEKEFIRMVALGCDPKEFISRFSFNSNTYSYSVKKRMEADGKITQEILAEIRAEELRKKEKEFVKKRRVASNVVGGPDIIDYEPSQVYNHVPPEGYKSANLPLIEVGRGCKFCTGYSNSLKTNVFCGHPSKEGYSYCEYHHKLCYLPKKVQVKRKADTEKPYRPTRSGPQFGMGYTL